MTAKSFHSSQNKDVVRREWDLPIIKQFVEEQGHKLSYLGMPGPKLLDLIDWRPYLARERTAVEGYYQGGKPGIDPDIQRQIMARCMSVGPDFSSGFELLRGDIESLILHGYDMDGTYPQCSAEKGTRWSYDLINLDFCGGVGYRTSRGTARRIKALHKLFERQQGHPFLLLLTLNVRSTLGKAIDEYLEDAKSRFGRNDKRFTSLLKRHCESPQVVLRLKAAIPYILLQFAEPYSFAIQCEPPLMYIGTGNAMLVHFVCKFIYIPRSGLPVCSDRHTSQSPLQLLELPLMEVRGGKIVPSDLFGT